MARYYRKRIYRRIYPRKKWASNFINNSTTVTVQAQQEGAYRFVNICENALQNATPTPVILKFARIKIKGDIRFNVPDPSNWVSAVVYCVYCPQAIVQTAEIVTQHPEYVLGWSSISMDSGNTFSLTSTLKRNLNSGDSIKLLFMVSGLNQFQQIMNFNFFYSGQFYTTTA